MQTQTAMSAHLTPAGTAVRKIPKDSVGEAVEPLEPSCTAGGVQIGAEVSENIENRTAL